MTRADGTDRSPRHPNPRPANFTQTGALFLRQGPWAVLVELDRGAGGNAQMEIKLAMEIFQVAVTVDEARQNGLALDINDLSAGGNRDFAALADRLEPAPLDHDDGILDRRPAGAIDQSSTLHHECFLRHVFVSFLVSISRLPQHPTFLRTLRQLTKQRGFLDPAVSTPQRTIFDAPLQCQRGICK